MKNDRKSAEMNVYHVFVGGGVIPYKKVNTDCAHHKNNEVQFGWIRKFIFNTHPRTKADKCINLDDNRLQAPF